MRNNKNLISGASDDAPEDGQMWFSIVIPVYNGYSYIKDCIDSLERQTNKSFEIIIVDDGSTDGSDLLCKGIAEQSHLAMRIVSQENSGSTAAREKGLSIARYEYVIFLDCDDKLNPDAIQTLSEALLSSEYDVVLFDYSLDDGLAAHRKMLNLGKTRILSREEALDFLCQDRINTLWGKCFLKTLLCNDLVDWQSIIDMHVFLGDDLLVLEDVLPLAETILYIDRPLYIYSETGYSHSLSRHHWIDAIKAHGRLVEKAKEWGPSFVCTASEALVNYIGACSVWFSNGDHYFEEFPSFLENDCGAANLEAALIQAGSGRRHNCLYYTITRLALKKKWTCCYLFSKIAHLVRSTKRLFDDLVAIFFQSVFPRGIGN